MNNNSFEKGFPKKDQKTESEEKEVFETIEAEKHAESMEQKATEANEDISPIH